MQKETPDTTKNNVKTYIKIKDIYPELKKEFQKEVNEFIRQFTKHLTYPLDVYFQHSIGIEKDMIKKSTHEEIESDEHHNYSKNSFIQTIIEMFDERCVEIPSEEYIPLIAKYFAQKHKNVLLKLALKDLKWYVEHHIESLERQAENIDELDVFLENSNYIDAKNPEDFFRINGFSNTKSMLEEFYKIDNIQYKNGKLNDPRIKSKHKNQ